MPSWRTTLAVDCWANFSNPGYITKDEEAMLWSCDGLLCVWWEPLFSPPGGEHPCPLSSSMSGPLLVFDVIKGSSVYTPSPVSFIHTGSSLEEWLDRIVINPALPRPPHFPFPISYTIPRYWAFDHWCVITPPLGNGSFRMQNVISKAMGRGSSGDRILSEDQKTAWCPKMANT